MSRPIASAHCPVCGGKVAVPVYVDSVNHTPQGWGRDRVLLTVHFESMETVHTCLTD